MKHLSIHIKHLFLLVAVAAGAVSCYDYDNNREICDYKVQLRYDYNEENTTTENRIGSYVHFIDEYLFDEAGVLYGMNTVEPDPCTGEWTSHYALPPGRYSVIGIGNKDERSTVTDVRLGGTPVIGSTNRNDMLLWLENCEQMTDNTSGPCEKLYHGYRTFTVKPRGISHVRVDMINAHFTLKFRVKWKNGATPPRGDYYVLLESVPSEYGLMPQYIYPAGSFSIETYDCDIHDLYPVNSNDVIHHIPYTCHLENNVHCHRNDTRINVDNEMWGEFTAYRIKDATQPKLRIFADDGSQVVRDIDLQAYFDWYGYVLDYELKQAYEIDITIDGDKIIIVPLDIADYEEGGTITGSGQ